MNEYTRPRLNYKSRCNNISARLITVHGKHGDYVEPIIVCRDCGAPAYGWDDVSFPYCMECSKKFAKETPYIIKTTEPRDGYSVIRDTGSHIVIENYYGTSVNYHREETIECRFDVYGRFVRFRGKECYI